MENNGKTELELNEEQLQDITGGCAQCDADNAQVRIQHATANRHIEQAAEQDLIGTQRSKQKARGLRNAAADAINVAQTYLNRIAARGIH